LSPSLNISSNESALNSKNREEFVLILGFITFCIALLIRYFFVSKHEYYVNKVNVDKFNQEYNELLISLKNLSPEQMDKLINDCEEWFKNKR
jgi:hypothetical protein